MSTSNPKAQPALHFRTALASPKAHKRIDALISADNAQEQVQALEVPDLFYLVNQVGLGDSIELLSLCTDEQIQGCVDMEIWDRDLANIDALLPWLAALQENGFEFLGRVWAGLDPELTALTLARCCEIYDKSLGEEVPDEEERDFFETPDTFFQIVIVKDDEVQRKLVHSIIEDLYRADMVQARHTLMAARSEPRAELEEMSYRWRSGRMADLGYVDFYEALEVFRPIDLDSVQIGEGTGGSLPQSDLDELKTKAGDRNLPAPMLPPLVGRDFLVRALEAIDNPDTAQSMQQALLVLVNRVMSAARLHPSQEEALSLATLHATSTLALGLEHVCGGDIDRAGEALQSISFTRLHRVGYTLTLRLARYARMMGVRILNVDDRSLSILDALLGKRPFYCLAVDEPESRELRPFESQADLAKIASLLQDLALRAAVAEGLGVDLVGLASESDPAERPDMDDFLRTALARFVLQGDLSASPLRGDELAELADKFADEGLPEGLVRTSQSAVESLLDERGISEARERLPLLVEGCLRDLAATFGPLAKSDVDPRFVSGLILTNAMS